MSRPMPLISIRRDLAVLSRLGQLLRGKIIDQAPQGRLSREVRAQAGPSIHRIRRILGGRSQWYRWSSPDRGEGVAVVDRKGRESSLFLPAGIKPRVLRLEPDPQIERLSTYPGDRGGYRRAEGNDSFTLEGDASFWRELASVHESPPRLTEWPLALQDCYADLAQAPNSYKPLQDPLLFAAGLVQLQRLRGKMSADQLRLFESDRQSERLFYGLFYLPCLLAAGTIDGGDLLRTLGELAHWERRLDGKFSGDDLLERVMRLHLPPFVNGGLFPSYYELEVARLLASRREVLKVASIIPNNIHPSPDFRIEVETPRGRQTRFVEVKVLQPRRHSLSKIGRERLFDLFDEIGRQFAGYPPSRFASGNTAYIAVIAERGDVDPTAVRETYQDWGSRFLRWQSASAVGRIDRLHFDFFGRWLAPIGELDLTAFEGTR